MSTWSCRLTMHPLAAARSGCLARVVGVFSDRGVSLEQVHAGVPGGLPHIDVVFVADEKAANALVRRLARLADVQSVTLGAL
jgi:acetolactate synthase regulatory subunit